MKTAQLSGSVRTNVGKKDAAAVRLAGNVPCVLYGQGEQTHFAVKDLDIEKIVFSPEVYLVNLDIAGKTTQAIIREIQQHPVKDRVMHVDFQEVGDKKAITVGLPVRLTGKSKGVLNGGRLLQVFRRLKVSGLAKDLPEAVMLDISDLKIGMALRVKDVKLDGVTILDAANAVVVSVSRARNSVMDEAAEDDDDDTATTAEGSTDETPAEA